MIYHVGLIQGSGRCYPLHRNGHRTSTVVVQMRRSIDYLSPQLWRYFGQTEATKVETRAKKLALLAKINRTENTAFTHIVID